MTNWKKVDTDQLDADLTSVADAIREKAGTSEALEFPCGFVDAINGIEGNGGYTPVQENDVNFYDYDGTLLYAYTLEEARALTELPPGPRIHKELTFLQWNWTLEQIKENNYACDVGAIYDTADGKTHLIIALDSDFQRNVALYCYSDSSTLAHCTIEWGDGSVTEQDVPNTVTQISHEYANLGEYTIRIRAEGSILKLGSNTETNNAVGGSYDSRKMVVVRGVHFASTANVHTSAYAFCYCRNLKELTAPTPSIGNFANSAFLYCVNLRHLNTFDSIVYSAFRCSGISIMSGGTSIIQTYGLGGTRLRRFLGTKDTLLSEGYHFYPCDTIVEARFGIATGAYNFRNCSNLRKVTILGAQTYIPSYFLCDCNSLWEFNTPETVTKIEDNAMGNCFSMARLRFNSLTPPTVTNANAFMNIPTDCIVEVPAESLELYQNATNYASIAAQMVGV